MLQIDAVGIFQFYPSDAFHQLGDGEQAGAAIGVEDIERGVSVDQHAGDRAVDAGEGDVLLVHG
ncbi:hypothetical protein EMIT0324P_180042 [Pseudomonas chlororaphis]